MPFSRFFYDKILTSKPFASLWKLKVISLYLVGPCVSIYMVIVPFHMCIFEWCCISCFLYFHSLIYCHKHADHNKVFPRHPPNPMPIVDVQTKKMALCIYRPISIESNLYLLRIEQSRA